jgi:hypothetical protein
MSATVTFFEVRPDERYRYLDLDPDRGGRWWLPGHPDGLEIDGRTWGDAWDPPPVLARDAGPEGDFCGISHISCSAFAVRPEAMQDEYLELLLSYAGELLPLPCEGREFTLVNVTNVVDALDWENSTKRGFSDPGYARAFNIDRPRFHFDRLGEQLFKIPEHATAAIYYWERSTDDPNEQLRRYCESSGLTGLSFRRIYQARVG